MKISVTDAKGQLTGLVRRAEGGEEIILTRHGHPAARILPMAKSASPDKRLKFLIRSGPKAERRPRLDRARRRQDFLYSGDGL
jgi:prevent-host-death family protein